jgi:UDP-2,4-diacetamido-2,4,6-trideoxy-beta-L-altropyranose hydrolase
MAQATLLIRADADTRMGTGHVMRCLALAQAWQDSGGRVRLAAASLTPALEARLRQEGIAVERWDVAPGSEADAARLSQAIVQLRAPWVVVDGYQFTSEYQRAVKSAGGKLLVIDDYGHASPYMADLVLNQNVHAAKALYRQREPATRLLLGPSYALLRREFWSWRTWQRVIPPVARRLLVTLGGSDPDNVTLRVIEAVAELDLDGLETIVVVGGSNPHVTALEAAAGGCRTAMRLVTDVTDMPHWMTWADAAVTAAGGTLWELAMLAVPSLTLILADNQEPAARYLDEHGIFSTLDWGPRATPGLIAGKLSHLLQSGDLRQQCSRKAAALVDGGGVFRVVEAMRR